MSWRSSSQFGPEIELRCSDTRRLLNLSNGIESRLQSQTGPAILRQQGV